MSTPQEFLLKLKDLGVVVALDGGRLRCRAAPGVLDAGLTAELRQRRDELVGLLRTANASFGAAPEAGLQPVVRGATSPLSFAQRGLWLLQQLEGASVAYNMTGAFSVLGKLDVARLTRALEGVLERHEVLRTVFADDGGEPVQIVEPPRPVELVVIDLRGAPRSELERRMREEAARAFDLRRGPLLRGALFQLAGDEHALLINVHHLVFDGASIDLFLAEMVELYDQDAGASSLAPLPLQYADYVHWQHRRLDGAFLDQQISFWRALLEGAPELIELPTDRPRLTVQSFAGRVFRSSLPAAAVERLRVLGSEHDASFFTALLSLFALLLCRYSSQDVVVVGSPVSLRGTHRQLQPLIGFFVNTLALPVDLSGEPSFSELLRRTQRTTLDAFSHAELPFETLVEELQPERSPGVTPVFQVLFDLQQIDDASIRTSGLELRPIEVEATTAKFDLVVSVQQRGDDRFTLSLEYTSALFDATTVRRMAAHFRRLLESVVAHPRRSVWAQELLTAAEKHQLLREGNDTAAGYPEGLLCHQRIAAQAARSPRAIALEFGGQTMTYRELDRRANHLAHLLRDLDVGPESRVGLCSERSPEMILAILAILKAGGAYLPLAPEYPEERLEFMLEDAGVEVLLISCALQQNVSDFDEAVICLDLLEPAWQSDEPPQVEIGDQHPAYVIYTSGSTGRPKGVVGLHRGLTNHMLWMQDALPLDESDRVLLKTPFIFDASLCEIFSPLLAGARIVLARDGAHRDAAELVRTMRDHRVTTLQVVPTLLHYLLQEPDLARCTDLRRVTSGGEELTADLWTRFSRSGLEASLINLYGPTEASIDSTFCVCPPPDGRTAVAIGRPVANVRTHVLDRGLRPLPAGVAGELHIAGAGLARGYLNRAALTAASFVPDPRSGEAGGRLYRTGDRARCLVDGRIEFLGRLDGQVKIRGSRLELGDVEAALRRLPAVLDAVVVVAGEGIEARLVAFLRAPASRRLEADALRGELRQSLPDAMIPASFVQLDTLPQLASGKTDRKALAALAVAAPEAAYIAPSTAQEKRLAEVWEELLERSPIGARDNFFDLGGNSLLATRMIARWRAISGREIALRSVFEHPTLRDLAAVDEAHDGFAPAAIEARPPESERVPSFSQERLVFLDQLLGSNPAYNISGALRLEGKLDREALSRSLGEVLRRHQVLRSVFPVEDGVAMVRLVAMSWSLPTIALDGLADAARDVAAHRVEGAFNREAFDLARGPLLRAALLVLGEEEHVLLISMHHVISDGWSVEIMMRECSAIYAAFSEGRPSPLPEPAIQFSDYAHWQRQWLRGEVLEEQLAYWRRQLAGIPEVIELPVEGPRPDVHGFRGRMAHAHLAPEICRDLEKTRAASGCTLFTLMLSAWSALLHRYSGQRDLVIGSPFANRRELATEDLIGFFVNNLVLRIDHRRDLRVEELFARVQRLVIEAHEHQDVPFERIVEEIRPKRSLAYHPIFQVMFVFQNVPEHELDLPGIRWTPVHQDSSFSRFDLSLIVERKDGGLGLTLEYSADLFAAARAERMVGHYLEILEAITKDTRQRVGALPLLSAVERRQLASWNSFTWSEKSRGRAHDLVAETCAARPDAVAASCQGSALTYRRLAERAGAVAAEMRRHGVGRGNLVALCVEPSLEMVTGLLAILEAGAAFLPLDPDYPQERLAFMLEDSRAPVVATQRSLVERVSFGGDLEVFFLDAPLPPRPPAQLVEVDADDLAYVIYTSGSTGRPKGAMNTHRGLCNLARNQLQIFGAGPHSKVLQFAPFSFDASVFEIFMALAAGAELCLAPRSCLMPGDDLMASLEELRISHVTLPPSALAVIEAGSLEKLGVVVTAGEACTSELVDRWAPGRRFFNAYGPSEATVWTTLHECRPAARNPPIGRPLRDLQVYLVDRRLERVPVGVPGELLIGGCSVGRGYLRRPSLTAEKFAPDPFLEGATRTTTGARLYRTGDLARFLDSGEIEFLGRIDHQVKVRGFRIELGEIESALSEADEVVKAAVIARRNATGENSLVAFVVGPARSASALKDRLGKRLPAYMVPSTFVFLPDLPVTPSGKVDRKALAALRDIEGEEEKKRVAGDAQEGLLADLIAEVLGLEAVGPEDDFFEIGGHSLAAARLVARIRAVFAVELPLRRLFELPRVRDLARHLRRRESRAPGEPIPPIPVAGDDGEGLSSAQSRLWFLEQLTGRTAAYNISAALRLAGELDVQALRRSLQEIVRRHEALRSVFPAVAGKPRIRVLETAPELVQVDLGPLPSKRREDAVAECLSRIADEPFDLGRGPLVRHVLLRARRDEHVLVLTLHHIIADGWSIGVFVRELSALYAAYTLDRPSPLPALPIHYRDYARWQTARLESGALDAQWRYWKETLDGAPEDLALPTDRPRPPVQTFSGGTVSFTLDDDLRAALKRLGRRDAATSFMTFLTAYGVLLARYSAQDDLLIGFPVANRDHPATADLIGLFVNTLVLRCRLQAEPTVSECLVEVRRAVLAATSHQEVPFETLVEGLRPRRALDRSPLFQVMLAEESTLVEEPEFPHLVVTPLTLERATSKFDLTLFLDERHDLLQATIEYNRELFDRSTIERMAGHLKVLLDDMSRSPEKGVHRLALLTADELRQLRTWNATAEPLPELCLHHLFEACAAIRGDAVAVAAGDAETTYEELNRWANRWAGWLVQQGVRPNRIVPLCVDRCPQMVGAMLAILKAGGAFLPLHPNLPQNRLAQMLEDSGSPLLLTLEKWVPLLEGLGVGQKLVCLDREPSPGQQELEDPQVASTPEDLAYVIYTSGSTGRPKGTMIPHRGLVNYALWAGQRYAVHEGTGTPVIGSFTFDATLSSLLVPLIAGQRVVLLPEGREIEDLAAAPAASDYSFLKLTPSHLELLAAALPAGPDRHRVRRLVVGGEALTGNALEHWKTAAPETIVVNEYGPTETVVGCLAYERRAGDVSPGNVPVGRPIANTEIHLLDRRMELVAVGVPGEIYIGGAGLARGYLGAPALTAERFLPVRLPLLDGTDSRDLPPQGRRLYRTGDLARRLPSGDIEYLGRVDRQVKLRGHRIEPGEIEIRMSTHPAVRQCVVVVDGEGSSNARLVAYFVRHHAAKDAEVPDLRSHLEDDLPASMLPAIYVELEALPLTPHGKLDLAALPDPAAGVPRGRGEPERDEIEEILAGIWMDLLRLPRVAGEDSFFELGGHSLLATQVIARIADAFGLEIPMTVLFEHPTLAELAHQIRRGRRGESAREVIPRRPDRPSRLSFAQQRLWVLDRIEGPNPVYNIPAAFEIDGALDAQALEDSLREVVRRHEILRSAITCEDDEPRLEPGSASKVDLLSIGEVDLRSLPAGERGARRDEILAAEIRRPFDLLAWPLMRVTLIRSGDTAHTLIVVMHHIISDGWSTGILIEEITHLYAGFHRCELCFLPQLSIQYADFAEWQREALSGDAMEEQQRYWRDRLKGAPRLLELPTDRPRPGVQTFAGESERFLVRPPTLEALRALCRRSNTTHYMALHTAFVVLLARYSGQRDLVVGCPIANRHHRQTEELIGLFVNTLALRVRLAHGATFHDILAAVRKTCFDAYAHQDLPFEKVIDQLDLERSLGHAPLFQVMLVLQNVRSRPVDLEGVAVTPLEIPSVGAKFDLTLSFDEGESLEAVLEYNRDLFDRGTVQRMVSHFSRLLEAMVEDPEKPFEDVDMLSADEREQLARWNQTDHDHGESRHLHEMFETIAVRFPDRIAVSDGRRELSYREFDLRAENLSHRLRQKGIGPDLPVGLLMERSVEMVLAIYAVLKAGGFYLPLDPEHPEERLAAILEDAEPALVLTQAKLAERGVRLASGTTEVLPIAADGLADLGGAPSPDVRPGPQNLAYAIYTSGSTGRPKGVMISHAAISNRILWMQERYRLKTEDRVLQKTPFSFDVSVWEFLWPLAFGSRLVVAKPGGHRDGAYLVEQIVEHRITTLHFVPSMLRAFLEEDGLRDLGSLRQVFASGEALDDALRRRFFEPLRGVRLHNLYGPTEAAVDVTSWECPEASTTGRVPIGKPIANTRIHLLDRRLSPVPVGVAGQLHIGGVNLGRGYLRRPALTAESFIADPWAGRRSPAGSRLYQTGDLARRLADGDVEYLGRIDHQVKVRGLRIELGEIEHALMRQETVQDAAVTVFEDATGHRRLVAYVVFSKNGSSRPPEALESWLEDLRPALERSLPEYMVPTLFVALENLPTSASGKLDRKALPAPERAMTRSEKASPGPRTEDETIIAEVWQEVLGLERIGVEDNFFELGGDSILSIQAVSRIRKRGLEVESKMIFKHPTVAALARVAKASPRRQVEQGAVTGPVPLTPIQHWFFDSELAHPERFNHAIFVQLPDGVDARGASEVLGALERHHDALRLRLLHRDGSWQQVCGAPREDFSVESVDLSAIEDPAVAVADFAARAHRSLDLAHRLWRPTLLKVAGGAAPVLSLVVHHLVVDGVSWRILLEDLATGLRQVVDGEAVALPPKTTSYKAWSRRLTDRASAEEQQEEVHDWRSRPWNRVSPLPVDLPGGANTVASRRREVRTLDPASTRYLLTEVPSIYGAGVEDVLLTAVAEALAAGRDGVTLIDLEGHGREEIFADVDISRTVGWFTSLYPVLLELGDAATLGDKLKAVKEQLRAVPHGGLGFGILRYLARVPDIRAIPRPQILFNYLGRLDTALGDLELYRPAQRWSGAWQDPANRCTHLIEIDSVVSGDRLEIGWSYSENVFRRGTVERLADRCLEALTAILSHCRSSATGGLTPSDFPDVDLDQQELDGVLEFLADEEDH